MATTMLDMNALVAQATEQLKAGRSIDDAAGFLQQQGIDAPVAYGLVDALAKKVQQEKLAPAMTSAPVVTPESAASAQVGIQQPASPLVGAQMMAIRGVRQTPLQPRTKAAFKDNWQQTASTDPGQLNAWATETPNCNWGSVATAQLNGIWIFDADNVDAIKQRIAETGHKFSELKTFQVRSSPKKGHSYFRHNAKSLALAAETGDKAYISIKAEGKEIASARLNNAYVVTPGSIHPDTGLAYEVVNQASIVEAPDWLIEWIKAQHTVESKLPVTASTEGPRVPRGSHDIELTRIAGKLRAAGLTEEQMVPILIENVEARFDDYGSDYKEMCEKVAHSIGKKPVVDTTVYHNGVPVGPIPQGYKVEGSGSGADRIETLVKIEEEVEPEIDDTGLTPRPVFPAWVMEGTSLYEHLVKPVVETSSKYPELVFMPGVLMFMNAIALRVRLKSHRSVPNMFLGLISPYGDFFKSSSCEVAMDYFKQMRFAASSSTKVSNPAITTFISSLGSPEGAGTLMKRLHGSKAVFYYDELGKFCAKATVEHSALLDEMLAWYESREVGNDVKASGSSYHFESSKYCFSWLWCTTDRKLPALWSKLTGSDSGLNNRMFFLLSPEQPKESGLYQEPVFDITATYQLISNALSHNVDDHGVATYDYEAEDQVSGSVAAHTVVGMDPRSQALFEHLALYFAIDLGKDCIDDACCARAEALVKYRNESEAYLDLFQSESKEGRLSHEIIRELKRNNGKIEYRKLYHDLHAIDIGLSIWNKTIDVLRANGIISTRNARKGKAGEQIPAMVYLLKQE